MRATLPVADVSDPPFLPARAPIVTVLDLPCPPSVNRIWKAMGKGSRGVYRAPQYVAWIKAADMALLLDRAMRGQRRILGPFCARIEVKRPAANCDIDNRIKAVLDFVQSRGFVADDKHLVSITACWSDVSTRGCRVTLTEVAC